MKPPYETSHIQVITRLCRRNLINNTTTRSTLVLFDVKCINTLKKIFQNAELKSPAPTDISTKQLLQLRLRELCKCRVRKTVGATGAWNLL